MGRMSVFFPVAFRGVIGSAHFPAARGYGPKPGSKARLRGPHVQYGSDYAVRSARAAGVSSVGSFDR